MESLMLVINSKKIIKLYKNKVGYSMDIMRQSACELNVFFVF